MKTVGIATLSMILAACVVEGEDFALDSEVQYGKPTKDDGGGGGGGGKPSKDTSTDDDDGGGGGGNKGGGKGGKTSEPSPLASALTDQPYFLATAPSTDVRAAVSGGTAPLSCAIYTGAGAGTVPLGVAQDFGADDSGCVLSGGVSEWDYPGAYGFTVIVSDAAGASVEIPIAYDGGPCDTSAVDILPAPAPVIVAAAGEAQSWSVQVTDVDAVVTDDICDTCLTASVVTRGPLSNSPSLDCANEGDVCVGCRDCDSAMTDACPAEDAQQSVRTIELDAHAPMRTSGPAWVSLGVGVNYSGVSLSPCGGKRWECHVAVLEL